MPRIKSAELQVNKKFEADTPDTILGIDVDPTKKLKLGSYVFQLQVLDDAKNISAPELFTVLILDETAPTAVITGPEKVPSGKAFTLSGEKSFDADDGKIVRYIWTLLKAP